VTAPWPADHDDLDGATPVDEEQRKGLRLTWVATRGDLNAAEADNILQARTAWRRRLHARGSGRLTLERLLDHQVMRELHRDMYGDVWAWAGRFRTADTNIGIAWQGIAEATAQLLANAQYWFAGESSLNADQAAARLHHKLVEIHPFPNGNGRHARELADLVLLSLGEPPFTWGGSGPGDVQQIRRAYINALVAADRGDYSALDAFVRS
jgi:Fic-DOC domain mobile mystery protein B